jgi:hypothetical protein
VYPVGCCIIRDDLTDPGSASVFGRGTWTKINEGAFLVTYLSGDPDFGTIGGTGGFKTATVPDHADHTHDVSADTVDVSTTTTDVTVLTPTTTGGVDPATALEHDAIDILPPFAVIALWKRTA